jgi:hypothetical protein
MAELVGIAVVVSAGTAIAVTLYQHLPTIKNKMARYVRMCRSKKMTISKAENPGVFIEITKFLDMHCGSLQHNTLITLNIDQQAQPFTIPELNTEVKICSEDGSLWISAQSLDGIHVHAYELTCSKKHYTCINKFLVPVMMNLNMPFSRIKVYAKLAEFKIIDVMRLAENYPKYSSHLRDYTDELRSDLLTPSNPDLKDVKEDEFNNYTEEEQQQLLTKSI